MSILFDAFWFFLPAGLANMSPVFAARLPLLRNWKTPIDMGRMRNGQRLLGANKTWRGLVFGALTGALVCYGEHLLGVNNFSGGKALLVGGVLGLGALVGDAVESYFKRRHNIKPGEAWFPFDQTDYIIGGLLFVAPFTKLQLELVVGIFVLYFGLHLVTSYIGYLVGLKDKPI